MMECNDVEWVSQSLAGSREAFSRIVEQYQSLVCSLTYSATGNLSQSQDMAQETFIIAWKELRQLREPEKLRSWLCSIARSVISRAARRQVRDPAHAAESIEFAEGISAPGPTPSEETINREEEAILWRSLASIPEIYREPLILFYREEQSVASVAETLGLSEDAVKQRLSRGRKLLTDEVTVFVQGMLKRTTPGRIFTLVVIAALPAFTISASATTIGATTGKSAAAAKAAASVGFAGAIFGPLLGLLGGWLGVRLSIENTESPRERQFVIKTVWIISILAGVFCAATLTFTFAVRAWWKIHPLWLATGFIGLLLVYGIALTILVLRANRAQQHIRMGEAAKPATGTLPPNRTEFFAPFNIASREYRSRRTLLGLPLIHVRLGIRQDGRLLPAKGWIAVGEIAYGALFGLGSQFAVAPISIAGGAAIGVLALGGGAAGGLLTIGGGFGFGAVTLGGGLAVGVLAAGGCAVGWKAALGGLAIARNFALGGAAFARHANDSAARAAIQNSSFFSSLHTVTWFACLIGVVALVIAIVMLWRLKRRAATRRESAGK
jgi:RNA polymerase sigma factor (sigma-70 family)